MSARTVPLKVGPAGRLSLAHPLARCAFWARLAHAAGVLCLAVAIVVIAGCAPPGPTMIVDLQADKVLVAADDSTPAAEVAAVAIEGCGLHGRRPEPLSASCAGGQSCSTTCNAYVGCFTTCAESCARKHYLFACLPEAGR